MKYCITTFKKKIEKYLYRHLIFNHYGLILKYCFFYRRIFRNKHIDGYITWWQGKKTYHSWILYSQQKKYYSYTTIVLKWNIKYESSRMNVPLSSSVVVIFEVTLWSSSCCGVASIVVKKTSEIFFYHNIHSKKSCSFDALQYFLRVLC